jgi:hypothetical protein
MKTPEALPPRPTLSTIAGLALAALAVLLCGCSTTKRDPSGFLGNERTLGNSGRAETFDEGWVAPKLKDAPAYAAYNKVFVAPVNTQYLARQGWWEAQNPGKRTSMQEDAAKLAGKTRSEFEKAIRNHPGGKFGVARRKGQQGTIDLEIAITELVPARAWFNAASTAAGFVLPGAGVLSTAGNGKITIEGRAKDSATGEVLAIFRDTEKDKTAPVSVNKYTFYRGVEESTRDWAKAVAELLNTPPTKVVKDKPAFTLKAW